YSLAAGGASTGAAAWAGEQAWPLTATTVLTWTVLPSETLISRNMPLVGAGSSAATMSVEISNRGSSRWTLSPTFFSHLVMVPSKMDSPICGITTSAPGAPLLPVAALAGACGPGAVSGAGGCLGVESPSACADAPVGLSVDAPSVEAEPPLAAAAFCAGCGAGAALAAAAPSASIRPTTVFTCTVAPSATLISFNTPLAGAGISASTLSVEISNRGSSRCTLSPGFFSHLVIVPSKIDSPIWGMTTSVGMSSFHLECIGWLEQP